MIRWSWRKTARSQMKTSGGHSDITLPHLTIQHETLPYQTRRCHTLRDITATRPTELRETKHNHTQQDGAVHCQTMQYETGHSFAIQNHTTTRSTICVSYLYSSSHRVKNKILTKNVTRPCAVSCPSGFLDLFIPLLHWLIALY